MKEIILKILRTGYSKTKKYKKEDLCKKLFILKNLIEDTEGGITCKHNYFWSFENNENRRKLIGAVRCIRKFEVRDRYYFQILNEFANGSGYGAKKLKEEL